ncbi:GLUG motif-containing protein [Anaerohalosphaeraceae bacterium U12dextr]
MRTLATILIGIAALSSFCQAYDWGTNPGDGSAGNPYQVSTAEQLVAIDSDPAVLDKHFIQTADIDLDPALPGNMVFSTAVIARDTDNTNDYTFEGVAFSGSYDGNGFAIRNLTITATAGEDFLGLFGYVEDGLLYRIRLENAAIHCEGTASNWCRNIGGLVGRYTDSAPATTIRDCSVDASITLKNAETAGGLIGHLLIGSAWRCFAAVSIQGSDQAQHLGGLIGTLYNASVLSDCYAEGQIHGTRNIGGLVGWNPDSELRNCWASVAVSGTQNVGGLVGNNTTSKASGLFWDKTVSGTTKGAGIGYTTGMAGKTTAEMQTQATFTAAGWDFLGESANGSLETWRMCTDGVDYARLNREYRRFGDFVCGDGVEAGDLMYFVQRWLMSNCAASDDCDGADINRSGTVNLADYARLAEYWLTM